MPAPDLAPLGGAQGRVSELARGPHLCPRSLPVGRGVWTSDGGVRVLE